MTDKRSYQYQCSCCGRLFMTHDIQLEGVIVCADCAEDRADQPLGEHPEMNAACFLAMRSQFDSLGEEIRDTLARLRDAYRRIEESDREIVALQAQLDAARAKAVQ
jgi:hypothetical protein